MKKYNRYIFRGKRVDNGEWVEGFLSKSRGENKQLELCIDHEEKGVMCSSIVIPKTVGQCTGLEDKNGKLIFEGDIIKTKKYGRDIGHSNVNDFDIFKVIYEPAVFRLENVRRGFNLVGNGNDFEVIGNVMDNSELLEVEE